MEDRKGCERGKSRTNKAVLAQPEASQALGQGKSKFGETRSECNIGAFQVWGELARAWSGLISRHAASSVRKTMTPWNWATSPTPVFVRGRICDY